MEIRPATLFDLAGVRRLLAGARLPVAGIAEHFGSYVVAEEAGELQAVGGLECYGDLGLLRSVVVSPGRRRQGLGRTIVQALLAEAARRQLQEVWLLTEGAEAFFAAQGFAVAPRESAPQALRATRQFTRLCPETATLMRRAVS